MDSKEVYNAVAHDKGKSLREKECKWLIEFCFKFQPKVVLDVGTGWGVTGRIFSLTADRVYSIDKAISGYARQQIAEHGNPERITFIQSVSMDAVLPIEPHSADLLFIDAGHPTLYVIADFLKFSRYVRDGGIICFHDCDRRDVLNALEIIQGQDPKLQEGYALNLIDVVDITRAYYWNLEPQFKSVDINRVHPEKAK